MLSIRTYTDRGALVQDVVESIAQQIIESASLRRQFHLALTGGEVGGEIAALLAEKISVDPDSFLDLHIWWSDERFVSSSSKDRNAFAFLSHLSPDTSVHVHQPTPSDSNIDVYASARRYGADINGIEMDLTLLSIGLDGHVASLFPSLFPSQWESSETSGVIAVDAAPKLPLQRVTFSLKKINESARVWILAAGESKAPIVSKLLDGDLSIPAAYVQGREETLLFSDFLTK